MKIIVLHGSPKGESSVTLQYMKLIMKSFPDHEYEIVQVAATAHSLEKDADLFRSLLEKVKAADAVLWSTPVFYLLVPSQLKRFIELVFARGGRDAFDGKYATALTTSAHFFDHTAMQYLHGVSEDLGMHFVKGYTAGMDDMIEPRNRESILAFAGDFFRHVEDRLPVPRAFEPLVYSYPPYAHGNVEAVPKGHGKRVVLLTDAEEADVSLKAMTDTFVKCMPYDVKVFNIRELAMKGGCISCYTCAFDNHCVYTDEFTTFFREQVLTADAVVEAGALRDRFLSSRWKMFSDRTFYLGHTPVFSGKALGFLISGPLRQLPGLQQILQLSLEFEGVTPAGIVTDEEADPQTVTALIRSLADQVVAGMEKKVATPQSFLSFGGRLVLRELVYRMRFFFKADDRYYREHGLYDFPQKDLGNEFQNTFMSFLLTLPGMREGFYKGAKEKMLEPYRKILGE